MFGTTGLRERCASGCARKGKATVGTPPNGRIASIVPMFPPAGNTSRFPSESKRRRTVPREEKGQTAHHTGGLTKLYQGLSPAAARGREQRDDFPFRASQIPFSGMHCLAEDRSFPVHRGVTSMMWLHQLVQIDFLTSWWTGKHAPPATAALSRFC